jgi:hypothetical protein
MVRQASIKCCGCGRKDKAFKLFYHHVTEQVKTKRVFCPECAYLVLSSEFDRITK